MSRSLNEVESMARKAARGAGFDWGMAEEAGQAARWLCARGLDGCALLAVALRRADTGAPGTCPLAAGAALSDEAAALAVAPVALSGVVAPALLLPFAAGASQALGRPVRLDWPGVTAVLDGSALSFGPASGPALTEAADVTVRPGGEISHARPAQSRAGPTPEIWAALTAYAERTYAPQTDQSRLRGAGAGLSDND